MDDFRRNQRRIAGTDPNPVYAGTPFADRVREKELQRVAESKGREIEKEDGGGYRIVDAQSGAVIAGDRYSFTLDDVERLFRGEPRT